ncbi:aminotransferase class I/II-fold pyridoxal phosphate-dependent enzyme [Christiangramia forsetii]|uniref:8-amino-7-oxononanoate synthase n=2 Tax=Christiangramia forsetii TaxID=411153 RepID=A0M7A4_CHRFK|nr:pyridoxal phosphate-dependent aminotransferase family protein [Christiangramia forsetii]GGG28337.1 8-amino-7-oxononanoate synthase [Christiangramia forsetii]CAL68499.1 8-amino-7-oxononanoate synthase [Christiangramia forsetii KT0803]
MKKLPLKLEKRLQKRKDEDSFRKLLPFPRGVDFFSNDYLGFSRSEAITGNSLKIIKEFGTVNGATGSRLLSGNHPLFKKVENQLASFHNSQSALIFNSGYDANIGFFSAVLQKADIILYDEFSHASIRDGLKMSLARNYKFQHNDLGDLAQKLERLTSNKEEKEIYIVTESVFSMDGDSPDMIGLVELAEKYHANLIVDEAHATGVFGEKGQGLVQQLKLESRIFARIHTFGKAMGCHGAVILGSSDLKDYLVNFSRSLIYTTALSPHAVATISAAYRNLDREQGHLNELKKNIQHFKSEILQNNLQYIFIESDSAIQACVISGNTKVKRAALELQKQGFIVKPILSPTVPAESERLRFCIHSYNSKQEISEVLKVLSNFVANSE